MWFPPTQYWACDYLSILWLKLIRFVKGVSGVYGYIFHDYSRSRTNNFPLKMQRVASLNPSYHVSHAVNIIMTLTWWQKKQGITSYDINLLSRDKMVAILVRRHFQVHFFEWKLLIFLSNVTETRSVGSTWQYGNIDWDNGLAPNRHQTIISTSVGMIYLRIYTSISLNQLIYFPRYFETGTFRINFNFRLSK